MSATVEHSVVINGERLPLHECDWVMFAPCGCAAGITVADLKDSRYQSAPIVTVDQAWEHMYDSRAERVRDQDLGFRFELMPRRDSIDLIRAGCTHDPEWGYEHAPTLDGYTWAAISAFRSRSPLKHLVPVDAVMARKNRDYRYGDTTPLCGGKAQWSWSDEWPATAGKVECKRCWSVAKKATS